MSFEVKYSATRSPFGNREATPPTIHNPRINNDALFRSQALQQQHHRLFGDVSLAQPVSLYLSSFVVSLLFLLLLSFLLSAEHHRKERIAGHLVPSMGMLNVYAKNSGTVHEVFVKEGDHVEQGDALVSMVNLQHRGSVLLEQTLIDQIEARIDSIEQSVQDNQVLLLQELDSTRSLLVEVRLKLNHTGTQIRLSDEQLALHDHRLRTSRQLAKAGHISKIDLMVSEERFLEDQQRTAHLRSEKLALQQEYRTATQQLSALPLRYALINKQLSRQKSELQQQLEETHSSFGSTVLASHSGRVTSVQVYSGQSLVAPEPILSIVPLGSRLMADLYLPTRSAGFVGVGQMTRLRFDAFPYQKFGLVDAEVIQVDKSLLLPDRSSQQLNSEPVYRIRAHLNQQALTLNEEKYPLKVGMQVEADVLLEKRRLIDWVLAPLVGLTTRLGIASSIR